MTTNDKIQKPDHLTKEREVAGTRDTQTRDAQARRESMRAALHLKGPLAIPEDYLPERDKYRYQWQKLDPTSSLEFSKLIDIGYEIVEENIMLGGHKSAGEEFLAKEGIFSTGGKIVKQQRNGIKLYLMRIPHDIYAEIEAIHKEEADQKMQSVEQIFSKEGFYGGMSQSKGGSIK